jgi:regulator of sigma E protease
MQTIIIFILVIVILVVGHELGHFFVAKAFGIRVDEFGIGYPPRAKKMFTWRGTLFSLNWLPFGGFVKIYGEELTDNDSVKSSNLFSEQTLWKRVAVVLAGVVANILIAFLLYIASFNIGFLATAGEFPDAVTVGGNQTIIGAVEKNSPAEVAGLHAGDVITQLTTATDSSIPKNVTEVINFVKKHPNDSIVFTVDRNGSTKSYVAIPKSEIAGDAPAVGISLAEVTHVRLPFWQSVKIAATYTVDQFKYIIHSIGQLISSSFGGGDSLITQVSGPLGIAQVANQAYSLGFGSFLSFVALISINLAVINLLPFPALDGGRCILEFFNRKGRSVISSKIIIAINKISFLLLILLMLYVTYHDILRF